MEIKEEHIRETERLLINGNLFDTDERVPFIKNLDSCDLLAVPGSGKTTVLLAKLYCLAKHLPFKDGSGILVLSHTNTAVNEIEKSLKKVVPILFEYPNFVGTVQSFVNKFLANPACFLKYGSYIHQNDNDIYEKEAEKFYYSLPWKNTEPKGLRNKLFGKVNHGKGTISPDEKQQNVIEFLKYFELDIIERKIKYNNKPFYTFNGTAQPYYLELEQWKEDLFSKGILNYRDSFYLGDWFIENNPRITSLLKKRFKYVFIDEMQDLEKYQIDIIDKIFYTPESQSTIQRIGDINQSIYNSGKKVKVETDWQPREPVMYLRDSYRLTKENADIVNFFTLDRQQDENGNQRFVVNGKRELVNAIKPHLILFDKTTKGKLKEKFKELIKENQLDQTVEGKKYGFKIIGWSAKWEDEENHDGKFRLEDIFEEYKKDNSSIKETYTSLSEYLQYFDKNKRTLKAARKAILNALIHILRIENKKHAVTVRRKDKERYYTKKDLIKYIQEEKNGSNYEEFKSKLYKWSFDLAVKQKHEEVYHCIKDFINSDFKEWFGFEITNETQNFIGRNFEKLIQVEDKQENKQKEGINIEIGTVHSVKGQTHCATMYVETAYQRPTYETQKIIKNTSNPLLFHEHNCNGTYDKQALKMMYVGFSRPTHLLCFAVLKENVKDKIENYKNAGWEIFDLTENGNDKNNINKLH
ncbi:UvrD-helicase domain-containing protein [Tenuifilum thalassicum]|uniref:DNA 3'-5' helicase II n=1 Tax=Tenuifilum thalassicum TaxID=2590900 RepID=A0A7D4BC33_9BACT|nr:UvrD-helicase domain-containing protein [Tenuifilum thalassicum]QKG80480.1 ATP-dependent helicase [Tenuifilum thalassicum]